LLRILGRECKQVNELSQACVSEIANCRHAGVRTKMLLEERIWHFN